MTANIMFVSDNGYVKNLGIASYSVLHHMCALAEKVRIFVMDCGISEENRQRLRRQTARFDNAEITFHNIERQLDEITTRVKNPWHKAIYGRLFLDELVRDYPDIERLVYFDCDLLMHRPDPALFTVNLQGKCLAGVADAFSEPRKQALGIDPDCTYINSGVLVIDAARWVALDASERIVEFIRQYPDELIYPDQDAINAVLAHEILILPPRHNVMWMLLDSDIPKMLRSIPDFHYNEEEMREALHHGSIYHFAGHDMWYYEDITPIHECILRQYYTLCDWRNEKRHYHSLKRAIIWHMVNVKRLLLGDWRIAKQSVKS